MDRISCITAAESAFQRTGEMLFKPFRFRYWLLLGLGAWLTLLGENPVPLPTTQGHAHVDWLALKNAVSDGNWHQLLPALGLGLSLKMLLVLGLGIVLLVLCVTLILHWVKAQGNFLYLEQILRRSPTVKDSFKRNLALGNSAFLWHLALIVISGLVTLTAFLLPLLLTWHWIKSCLAATALSWPDTPALCGLVLSGCGSLTVIILDKVIKFYFYQFIIPLMYLKRQQSWSATLELLKLFSRNPLVFLKYLLLIVVLKSCLAFAVVMAVMALIVVTCCLALIPLGLLYLLLIIPYVWAVAALPVLLFFRLCGLELLNQMNRQQLFTVKAPEPSSDVPGTEPETPTEPPPPTPANG